jgi:predicted permease
VLALINAVLLQALPFENPDRLAFVRGQMSREGAQAYPISYLDIESMAAVSGPAPSAIARDVAGVTGARPYNLTAGAEVEHVLGEMATASYLRVLGVGVQSGRWFSDKEARAPGERVVVIGNDLWQRRFGGRPDAVGSTILLNEQPYTVIGVARPAFTGVSDAAQLWLPLGLSGVMYGPHYVDNREFRWLSAVARLDASTTQEQFANRLDAFSKRLEAAFPKENGKFAFAAQPVTDAYFGGLRRPLLALLAGAALVLLIACSNVANLVLVRAAGRQRDVAVRIAIGASLRRIVQSVAAEMVVMGTIAAVIGTWFAIAASRLIVVSGALPLASFVEVKIDPLMIGATTLLAVGCALVCGIVPAYLASRADPAAALGEASRGSVGGRNRRRLQRALVSAQVAVALTLLIGAGLVTRGFSAFIGRDLGFRADGLASMRVDLVADRYRDNDSYLAFTRALTELARQTPGVSSVALEGPGFPTGGWYLIHVRADVPGSSTVLARRHHVTAGYLSTLGIRLLEGRAFGPSDLPGTADRNIIVSAALAKRIATDGRSVVGRRLVVEGPGGVPLNIVGVAADVVHSGRDPNDTDSDIYIPIEQSPARSPAVLTLFARANIPPATLERRLAEGLKAIDRNVSFYDVASMDERLDRQTTTGRFLMVLMIVFGIVGLVLAAIGTYGVISYGVVQRTREIGVRLALGADAGEIVRVVVVDALIPAGIGAAAGLAMVAALHKTVASLLYGMSAMDPATIAAALGVVGITAVAASVMPARKAARIDPAVTLRSD